MELGRLQHLMAKAKMGDVLSWVRATMTSARSVTGNRPRWGAEGILGWLWFPLVSMRARMRAATWVGHGCSIPQDRYGLDLGCSSLGRTPAPSDAHESQAGYRTGSARSQLSLNDVRAVPGCGLAMAGR